ncbi:MAG: hypothetical protein FD156_1776 [Nitrospirae bacterium]|nr:MAG: hypothetical protein FD156_1776 [Nitrospirota bacterium]
MKRYINIYTSIVFIAIAYFLVTLYFALPYRFFPGDEVTFLEQVQDTYEINNISLDKFKKKGMPAGVIENLSSIKVSVYKYYDYRDTLVGMLGQEDFNKYNKTIFKYTKRPFLLTNILKTYQPVFYLGLHINKIIWSYFSSDYNSTLAFSSALCTSITLIFIALIIYQITSSQYLSYLGLILYATSTWVLSYYFFYSYVVFAAMFGAASTYFLILAYFKKKDDYIVAAGILSALLFLSSTSAPPFIAVQAAALFFLFYGQVGALKKVFIFITTMYITIAPLFAGFLYEFEVHLFQNITANNYILSNKLPVARAMPEVIYILWAYNKVFVVYFFVLLAIFLYNYLSNRFKKDIVKETDINKRVLLTLISMVFLYTVLMASTGYFAVTRVYFIIYPIFIIVFCSLLNNDGVSRDNFIKNSWKFMDKAIRFLHLAVIIAIVYSSLTDDIDLLKVRREAPQFLQTLISKHYKSYYISEDPHVPGIKTWLVSKIHKEFEFETVSKNTLNDIVNARKNNEKIAIIVKGTDSLISDLSPILNKGKSFALNFSGFFAFLLEDDVARDMFFSGEITKKNHRSQSQKIKVVLFE